MQGLSTGYATRTNQGVWPCTWAWGYGLSIHWWLLLVFINSLLFFQYYNNYMHIFLELCAGGSTYSSCEASFNNPWKTNLWLLSKYQPWFRRRYGPDGHIGIKLLTVAWHGVWRKKTFIFILIFFEKLCSSGDNFLYEVNFIKIIITVSFPSWNFES